MLHSVGPTCYLIRDSSTTASGLSAPDARSDPHPTLRRQVHGACRGIPERDPPSLFRALHRLEHVSASTTQGPEGYASSWCVRPLESLTQLELHCTCRQASLRSRSRSGSVPAIEGRRRFLLQQGPNFPRGSVRFAQDGCPPLRLDLVCCVGARLHPSTMICYLCKLAEHFVKTLAQSGRFSTPLEHGCGESGTLSPSGHASASLVPLPCCARQQMPLHVSVLAQHAKQVLSRMWTASMIRCLDFGESLFSLVTATGLRIHRRFGWGFVRVRRLSGHEGAVSHARCCVGEIGLGRCCRLPPWVRALLRDCAHAGSV